MQRTSRLKSMMYVKDGGHDGYLNVEVVKEEGVIYIREAEALEQLPVYCICVVIAPQAGMNGAGSVYSLNTPLSVP